MSEKFFDFIIGNPPYQMETAELVSNASNKQTPKKNVFHLLQIEADKLANESTVMIYPAGRWIQRSGKGLADFGLEQINDKKLQEIRFYPNAKEIFPSAAIADGISIVIKKTKKNTDGFQYVYCENGHEQSVHVDNPGENIIPLNPNDIAITTKIETFVNKYCLQYMHDRVLPRSLFGIESDFVSKNAGLVRPFNENDQIDYSKEIKLFTNDKAGKAGRAKWFVVDRSVIVNNPQYISYWKVVVSSANAGGQKRDNQLEIIDNKSAFGRSRVALAVFNTKAEAKNFYQYVKSYIIRYAFLMTDEALTTLALKVPDIQDYSSNNNIIDFSKNIDMQLCELIGLTQNEMNYLKSVVDSLRGGK